MGRRTAAPWRYRADSLTYGVRRAGHSFRARYSNALAGVNDVWTAMVRW